MQPIVDLAVICLMKHLSTTTGNSVNTATWHAQGTNEIVFYDNGSAGIWHTTTISAGSTKHLYLSITVMAG